MATFPSKETKSLLFFLVLSESTISPGLSAPLSSAEWIAVPSFLVAILPRMMISRWIWIHHTMILISQSKTWHSNDYRTATALTFCVRIPKDFLPSLCKDGGLEHNYRAYAIPFGLFYSIVSQVVWQPHRHYLFFKKDDSVRGHEIFAGAKLFLVP